MEQTNDCKCLGDKKAKALQKQITELRAEIEILKRQVAILRKAVCK